MPGPTDLIFSAASGKNTGGGATTATHTISDTTHTAVVRHISGHGDKDATITIESPASTEKSGWVLDVSLNANTYAVNIPDGIVCTKGEDAVGKLSDSTASARVQISGYERANL